MASYTQDELNEKIRARFKELPEVIQKAITSADVQKQLRRLADTKKLHLDQWQLLENNVMLTLLGFQPPEELADNLKNDLVVSSETANQLATDISRIVFEPIRQELERQLEHPEAKEKIESAVEQARSALMSEQRIENREQLSQQIENREQRTAESEQQKPLSAPIMPATPPPSPPTEKAIRAPSSGAYKTGEASSQRRDIVDDPYREAPQ